SRAASRCAVLAKASSWTRGSSERPRRRRVRSLSLTQRSVEPEAGPRAIGAIGGHERVADGRGPAGTKGGAVERVHQGDQAEALFSDRIQDGRLRPVAFDVEQLEDLELVSDGFAGGDSQARIVGQQLARLRADLFHKACFDAKRGGADVAD